MSLPIPLGAETIHCTSSTDDTAGRDGHENRQNQTTWKTRPVSERIATQKTRPASPRDVAPPPLQVTRNSRDGGGRYIVLVVLRTRLEGVARTEGGKRAEMVAGLNVRPAPSNYSYLLAEGEEDGTEHRRTRRVRGSRHEEGRPRGTNKRWPVRRGRSRRSPSPLSTFWHCSVPTVKWHQVNY